MGDDRTAASGFHLLLVPVVVAVSGWYRFPNGFCTDCAGPSGRLQGGLATANGFTFLSATGRTEGNTEEGDGWMVDVRWNIDKGRPNQLRTQSQCFSHLLVKIRCDAMRCDAMEIAD